MTMGVCDYNHRAMNRSASEHAHIHNLKVYHRIASISKCLISGDSQLKNRGIRQIAMFGIAGFISGGEHVFVPGSLCSVYDAGAFQDTQAPTSALRPHTRRPPRAKTENGSPTTCSPDRHVPTRAQVSSPTPHIASATTIIDIHASLPAVSDRSGAGNTMHILVAITATVSFALLLSGFSSAFRII